MLSPMRQNGFRPYNRALRKDRLIAIMNVKIVAPRGGDFFYRKEETVHFFSKLQVSNRTKP